MMKQLNITCNLYFFISLTFLVIWIQFVLFRFKPNNTICEHCKFVCVLRKALMRFALETYLLYVFSYKTLTLHSNFLPDHSCPSSSILGFCLHLLPILVVYVFWSLLPPFIFTDPGFVETLESPGILLFRHPGLESPGKGHRSWKAMEIPGKSWNSKAALLDFFCFCFE